MLALEDLGGAEAYWHCVHSFETCEPDICTNRHKDANCDDHL